MLVYKDYNTYKILDTVINVISSETDYGPYLIGEIDDEYHYLDSGACELTAAVLLWQSTNGRELTNDEMFQIIEDNKISSEENEEI